MTIEGGQFNNEPEENPEISFNEVKQLFGFLEKKDEEGAENKMREIIKKGGLSLEQLNNTIGNDMYSEELRYKAAGLKIKVRNDLKSEK